MPPAADTTPDTTPAPEMVNPTNPEAADAPATSPKAKKSPKAKAKTAPKAKAKKSPKATDGTPKPAGRPATKITWPRGKFTLADACAANANLCKMTISNRLSKAVDAGEVIKLDEVGKVSNETGTGRPPFLYSRAPKNAE